MIGGIKTGLGIIVTMGSEHDIASNQQLNVPYIAIDMEYIKNEIFANLSSDQYSYIHTYGVQPGSVLTVDNTGRVVFDNPSKILMNEEHGIHEKYPELKDSWEVLMVAMHEYMVTRKLIMDHDKKDDQ